MPTRSFDCSHGGESSAEDSFAGNDRVLLGGGDLANDLTCQSLRRVAGEDQVRLGGGAGRCGVGWGGGGRCYEKLEE